jgi:hypothetical protein
MKLTQAQQSIANDKHRFRVCVAGRRFGKTHLAIRELCYHARLPEQEIWYVAPTYRQAKTIVWRKLKNRLQDLRWIAKVNEAELSITLKNNTTIALKGADNADSLRGIGLDFLCCDEFADIAPEAWYEVLRPTLADREGSALFIGTPKGVGNWAHDLYQMALEIPEVWSSYQFTTLEGGQVSAEEVEAAKRDLDERTFRQEFMATFETYSGRIYYAFDRKSNTEAYAHAIPGTLYIGMDFNIDPCSAVIAALHGDTLHIIDEIRIFGSNTNEMASEILARYPRQKIMCYPDPAGRQRKTSAGGMTDIIILQNAGFVVKAPHQHTPVRDRINSVNARLCSEKNQRRLIVDPKCKHTIEGLERHSYKEGSSQPDKDSGYDHMMDALGYLCDYLFPLRKETGHIEQPLRWGLNTGVRK